MYESPVIKFEEITFFEKIACDECWNHTSFSFDNPFTKNKIEQNSITISSDRCGDKETLCAVNQALSYLKTRQDIKYLVYAAFSCDKQNTRMWGFNSVLS
jgi:hypothetical protein